MNEYELPGFVSTQTKFTQIYITLSQANFSSEIPLILTNTNYFRPFNKD